MNRKNDDYKIVKSVVTKDSFIQIVYGDNSSEFHNMKKEDVDSLLEIVKKDYPNAEYKKIGG